MYHLWRREGDLRADQMVLPHEFLAQQRVLFLYGFIVGMPGRADTFSPSYLADTMIALAAHSSDPIYLVIDSVGGNIRDGYVLLDTMQTIDAPVYTIGRNCYSMAAVLLAAGEKGHRYIYPNARVLLHLPVGGFEGDAKEIEIQAAETRRVRDDLVKTLRTNGVTATEKELLRHIDREKWMTAEEAVRYGLADHIVTKGFFGRERDVPNLHTVSLQGPRINVAKAKG